MVTVEIISTGEQLEIVNQEITYIKQVADFGNITTSNASYSWNFKTPKTPENTMMLENLGIVGDTSSMPYRKIYCRLMDNGTPIVEHGLLNIKETDEFYNLHIQAGIIDFYTALSNDLIGEVINLRELNHENTIQNIISSWTDRKPYNYVLADFNGPRLPNSGGVTNLDIQSLVPSVNLKWLWDQIFKHYGWTYEGEFDFIELKDQWLSYPSALAYEEATENEELLGLFKRRSTDRPDASEFMVTNPELASWTPYEEKLGWQAIWTPSDTPSNSNFGELSSDGRYWINKQAGQYRITWRTNGLFNSTRRPKGEDFKEEYQSFIAVNQTYIPDQSHSSLEEEPSSMVLSLQPGDKISVVGFFDNWRTTIYEGAIFQISQAGVSNVNFNQALIKFKVRDFFKEIMVRLGITPFPDTANKKIYFKSWDQRIDADTIDWSNKYVDREKESYLYQEYARNNYLKHKYDEDQQTYNDGNIRVNNQNLEAERPLYESPIFSPQELLTEWNGVGYPKYYVPQFKLFEKEVQEGNGGEVIIKHKSLKDRFYIFRAEWRQDVIAIIGNQYTGFPMAITTGTLFKQIAGNQYGRTQRILSETRVHLIKLALTKFDIATLELDKKYFFEQQNSYYILNKITWKNEETCVGEFIRVKL